MLIRFSFAAVVLSSLVMAGGTVFADETKYPDWQGAWARFVVPGLGFLMPARKGQRPPDLRYFK